MDPRSSEQTWLQDVRVGQRRHAIRLLGARRRISQYLGRYIAAEKVVDARPVLIDADSAGEARTRTGPEATPGLAPNPLTIGLPDDLLR